MDHIYFRVIKNEYLNLVTGKYYDIDYYMKVEIKKQFDNIVKVFNKRYILNICFKNSL